MLYNFTIFARGGLILWSREDEIISGDPVSGLIRDILLKEKHNEQAYTSKDQQYVLQWTQDNVNHLFFVAVVPKGFAAPYVSTLLEKTQEKFRKMFPKCEPFNDYSDFTPAFQKLYNDVSKEFSQRSKPKTFAETEKGQKVVKRETKKDKKRKKQEEEKKNQEEQTPEPEQEKISKLEKLKQRGGRRGGRMMKTGPPAKKSGSSSSSENKTKSKKKMQTWDHDPLAPVTTESAEVQVEREIVPEINLEQYESSESSEEEEFEQPQKSGFFSKYLPSLTGSTLTADKLEPIMEKFKNHLTEKNVASEVAQSLCDSVAKSLEGTKLSTFSSAKKIVNEAMADSLTRILTPKKQIDIVREIAAANAAGRPYSIVFVGVNGVGKSTSLSKVCSWLQQNEMKVLIAACDTFRSGAVEQLKVHCGRLNVPLFEQGYGKDASHIAAAAIRKAQQDGMNVVLVDTAGRMQDNEPLMKALSSLVHYNNPDLVLFVGEALVGNDGVHQLQNFNRSLELLSTKTTTKIQKDTIIDGVMLTKFDTIDDKVGAAVSMVYSTGIPIIFVGVGQHYQDIKKLNVGVIVKALMK